MGTKVTTFDGPAIWAAALVNGDYSGLEESEAREAEQWAESLAPWSIVACEESTWFGRFPFPGQGRLGCDMVEFIAHAPA